MSVILNPVEQYFDLEGNPLQGGYLYFGEVYGNPVTQPVMVYFDPEFTIPAAQPIRTVNGFPVRSGTATGIYAPDDVSILVQNQNKEQVIYIESSAINTGDTTTIYRESNIQLNSDDNNRTFIALTPFTQTFEPSVNLGDRWRVTIINMSSGNIILDPNLSETIDGQSTLQVQPNQALNVYCDGVNLKTTSSVFPTTAIPSAATLDLRAVKPKVITVSGTNTISAVQMLDGDRITAVFSGACQLTHGTNLQIPGSVNFTTSAGDIVTFSSNGTITRAEISRANGAPTSAPLNATSDPTFSSISSILTTSPEWTNGRISNTAIGINQTWQDLTASRALGTTYTNSTGRPIFVGVSLLHGAVISQLTVNGIVVSSNGGNQVGEGICVVGIVPDGNTYSVNTGNTLTTWAELR